DRADVGPVDRIAGRGGDVGGVIEVVSTEVVVHTDVDAAVRHDAHRTDHTECLVRDAVVLVRAGHGHDLLEALTGVEKTGVPQSFVARARVLDGSHVRPH